MAPHDIGTRLQALTLLEHGIPHATVTSITGMSTTAIFALQQRAIERGYDSTISKKLNTNKEYLIFGELHG